jgi:hypothetical protein
MKENNAVWLNHDPWHFLTLHLFWSIKIFGKAGSCNSITQCVLINNSLTLYKITRTIGYVTMPACTQHYIMILVMVKSKCFYQVFTFTLNSWRQSDSQWNATRSLKYNKVGVFWRLCQRKHVVKWFWQHLDRRIFHSKRYTTMPLLAKIFRQEFKAWNSTFNKVQQMCSGGVWGQYAHEASIIYFDLS